MKTRASIRIKRVVRERFHLRVGQSVYCNDPQVSGWVVIHAFVAGGAIVSWNAWDGECERDETKCRLVALRSLLPSSREEYTAVNNLE